MKPSLILTALALLAGASSTHAGTHTWSGAGANKLWSNPANWTGGGAPSAGEAGPIQLDFPIAGAKTSIDDIPGLHVDTIRLFGSGYTLSGSGGVSLTLRGTAATALYSRGVNNVIAGSLPLVLQGTNVVEIDGGANSLLLLCAMSGAGGITKAGAGPLAFAGVSDNTYTGTTKIISGQLRLGNGAIFPQTAVAGPLVIGDGSQTNSPSVALRFNHQIVTQRQ